MSTWGNAHGGEPGPAGARWRSLAGDTTNQAGAAPTAGHAAGAPAPIHGGWTQPWQDAHGQWHYPYGAQQEVPTSLPLPVQYVVAEPVPGHQSPPATAQTFVAPEELAPVGPPRYAAPVRAVQDPRQRTLAAVIVFVCLIVALWAILGFMSALASTLSSIDSGNGKLKLQLADANAGLASIDRKTRSVSTMGADATEVGAQLGGIDASMGAMLQDVDKIATGMEQMDATLRELDGEIGTVDEINTGMGEQLGTIAAGLRSQVASVRRMRRDVVATGSVLGSLDGRMSATNGRLGHINNSVNIMGVCGISNQLEVDIFLGPLRNGGAKVYATVIPPNAWGTRQGRTVPC